MAKRVMIDIGDEIGSEKVEMFKGNPMIGDIAVVENLLMQMIDLGGIEGASVYDDGNGMDWDIEDILKYLQDKYEFELKAYRATCPVITF